MFSILNNFFKTRQEKKLYLARTYDTPEHRLNLRISALALKVLSVKFTTTHSSSFQMAIVDLPGRGKCLPWDHKEAPSKVKFAKVKGSSSLPLFHRFWWSLENRKWVRSLLCKGSSFSAAELPSTEGRRWLCAAPSPSRPTNYSCLSRFNSLWWTVWLQSNNQWRCAKSDYGYAF